MKLLAFATLVVTATHAAEHASAPFFKVLDRTADGNIRAEEVDQSGWVKRLDKDASGGVSAEEFAAGWDQFPTLRGGLARMFPEVLAGKSTVTPPPLASPRQGARALAPAEAGIGRLIPDLKLTTLSGEQRGLATIAAGRTLVIANFSATCPVSKRYAPTLLELQKQHPAVAFIFLATHKTDTAEALLEALPGATIVRDPEQTLLRALGAKATTDCFVLDPRRTLQYRGAVDDQYGLGYSLEAPRVRLLADALAAIAEGRMPAIQATEAPGCELELSRAVAAKEAAVTFHNRISRLLQQNCQECHRAGGVAPFPLETLEQVGEHAGMIRKMVSERLMPPWFAAPPEPGGHSPWLNDRSLPEQDRADLLGWLASGRPVGDPKDAPLPRKWPEGAWAIGTPDAILQIPQPIAVKATGTMPYQTVRIPSGFAETRYVSAVEVLPTARDVVHHVLVFADPPPGPWQNMRRALGRPSGDDAGGFFGIYVPGNHVLSYPEGFAKVLPAGSTLRLQIHYTPNGKATEDQVRIGLKFTQGKPRHLVENAGISNHRLAIPPGAANHPVEARLPVPRDAVILAFLPHMHLRGKAWRYEVITPGHPSRVLLDVPRYDFNWQLLYRLADPVLLPAGSVIKATGWFDNSPGNPANPDPGKLVRWGPQTSDEMMLGYVEYYLPGDSRPSEVP